jgi:small nuclear ribonucleoprotein (snRNP)-like protein
MGYHINNNIKKGNLGEFSKIKEEFEELEDAFNQQDVILQLCEMSDLIGSIEEYLKKWNLSIDDLKSFSNKTKSAFLEGKR